MVRCSECGKEMEDGAGFCSACGSRIVYEPRDNENQEGTGLEAIVKDEYGQTLPKEKKKAKGVLWGVIGVTAVALALAVFLIIKFIGGQSEIPRPQESEGEQSPTSKTEVTQPTEPRDEYLVYMKDEEGFVANLTNDVQAWQITSKLIDDEDIGLSNMLSVMNSADEYVHLSEDGSRLFYPDKLDWEDEGVNLYYRDLEHPDSAPVKIDSAVQSFVVNTEANCVTYIKGESKTLYQYFVETESKEKIATEIEGFHVTADGNKVGYMNSEYDIYLKYAGQEAEKIASDIQSLEAVNNDLSVWFYIKDDALYKQEEGKERIKLAKNVDSVVQIYESGEVYYHKKETVTKSLLELMKDDLKESDAAMEYPVEPTYPNSYDYETYDQYLQAYESYRQAYTAYEKAYYEYQAAMKRNDLRHELGDRYLEMNEYSLYYYDGSQEIKLADTAGWSCSVAKETPVIVYKVYDRDSEEKVKFSEICDGYDFYQIENAIIDKRNTVYETYICIKNSTEKIKGEGHQGVQINDAGTVLYYLGEISENEYMAEQYRVCIEDGKVQQPELVDQEVYAYRRFFDENGRFVYFKDVNDAHGDLYIDQKKIDYDVYIYGMKFFKGDSKVVYFTDMDNEKQEATLKVFQDDAVTKIADDVYVNNYVVTADDRILYLQDYNREHYRGELYEWDSGEKKKLDDDVMYIVDLEES